MLQHNTKAEYPDSILGTSLLFMIRTTPCSLALTDAAEIIPAQQRAANDGLLASMLPTLSEIPFLFENSRYYERRETLRNFFPPTG